MCSIYVTVLAYSNVIARTITRVREYEYTHAYNCSLADQNGRLLCGKQKTLYLCNKAVLGKTLLLKQCPHSAEAVGIAL